MKQHAPKRADKSREMDFAVLPGEQEEPSALLARCTGTSDSEDGVSASGGTREHGTFLSQLVFAPFIPSPLYHSRKRELWSCCSTAVSCASLLRLQRLSEADQY